MEEKILVTKRELKAAMLRWVQQDRAGRTKSLEETREMSDDQLASECTKTLWDDLKEHQK